MSMKLARGVLIWPIHEYILLTTVCVKTITADRIYIQMILVYWLNKYCAKFLFVGTKSYIANVQGQAW